MGLIGENPHPLVSARSLLRSFSSQGFAQGCHAPISEGLGFPEFTRFSTPGHPEALLFLHEPLGDSLRRNVRAYQHISENLDPCRAHSRMLYH